ncbi:hypothetical protein V1508DRAFT_394430 [Lipomyces doorenjongii]|uniref:uncharacterized protein n=1 Tax=Lipomyces doorenjongii TaxID=383834 RepID=UPI0034CD8431
MRNKFRPKHQRLILQCYPGGRSQEKHPNTSELSYLLYYVSTRRTKLQKVGRFLERKVRSDVWRGRAGNVQVTLDISKALIDRCPSDLNVFADFIISILMTVLNSNDLALCQYTDATFQAFCEHHDGGLLADDQEFVRKFVELLKLYMKVGERTKMTNDLGWVLVSLKAAKSIAASEAISTSNGQSRVQIDIIAPVILHQMYSDTEDDLLILDARATTLESSSNEATTRTPRTSTGTIRPHHTDDVEDDSEGDSPQHEASVLALQALRKLFDAIHDNGVSQIRYASIAVVHFIIDHPKNETWATNMIDLMARWTPVQLRFVIMRSLLEVTASLAINETSKHLVVTRLISSLLSSSVNLVGLSVLDVLHVLFSQILSHLHQQAKGVKDEDGARKILLDKLTLAIADLATHTYYSDQISDMVTEILVRLRPITNEEHHENANGNGTATLRTMREISEPPSTVGSYANLDKYIRKGKSQKNISHKPALVIGLKVVKEILSVANTVESGVTRNIVPLQAWNQTEWAITEKDAGVNIAYVNALLTYFDLEIGKDPEVLDVKKLSTSGFLARLHLALYDYCLELSNKQEDFEIINVLLLTVVDRLGLYGILRGLPMVLQLQDTIHNFFLDGHTAGGRPEKSKLPARNLISLDSIILTYISAVAKKLGIPDLDGVVEAEIAKRKAATEWDESITNPPKPLSVSSRKTKAVVTKGNLHIAESSDNSEDEEETSSTAVVGSKAAHAHVDRSVVKTYLQATPLKMPDEIKLELTAEWQRELIIRQETDSAQSSIGDSELPLIRVRSRTRSKPRNPIRLEW